MKKKIIIIGAILAIAVLAGFWGIKKSARQSGNKIYEAAVLVRGQENDNPAHDRAPALMVGDVVSLAEAGYSWSKTEKISYLILRLRLSEEEKNKLLRPLAKDAPDANAIGKEILKLREYYIDLAGEFKGFSPDNLLSGQPYYDKIFDWGIVKKRKE